MAITICFKRWIQAKSNSMCNERSKLAIAWMIPEASPDSGSREQIKLVQEYLGPGEKEKYRAFYRNSRRQYEMLQTRVLAKRLIHSYLYDNYELTLNNHKEILIANVENGERQGKPYIVIKGNIFAELRISLAHCRKMLGAVIGEGCLVGIDVEELKPVGQSLLDIFLDKEEKQLLTNSFRGLDSDQKIILLWCAKEAIGKALGTGFSLGFSSLRFRSGGENCSLKLELHEGLNKYLPYMNPQSYIYYDLAEETCRVLSVIRARDE
ncbi:MAG TPA: 4'-phosphopantetheinyl transferase superfamily protein [Desulfitobacteriaceae bacterium]|nr:4'-phosphopantetheinyl transferase superfamily protein [Desulfitobacteriaceae bacterium]